VRDAGNLLTRAGLAMPTVDVDTFKLNYPCPTDLIRHLRVSRERSEAARGIIELFMCLVFKHACMLT
jgi:NADH dehydrogenase [ubiquinone] 1 alpha subcomplex assembly factor 5